MKITQLGIYMPHIELAIKNLENIFGEKMFTDNIIIEQRGTYNYKTDLNLAFNKSLLNITELEFCHTENKKHWHHIHHYIAKPFMAHLGIYCDDKEFNLIINKMNGLDIPQLQNTISSRDYHDVVFQTEKLVGFNLQITRKVS